MLITSDCLAGSCSGCISTCAKTPLNDQILQRDCRGGGGGGGGACSPGQQIHKGNHKDIMNQP